MADFYDIMSGIESKGKYDANRPGSAYYGKYQFHEGSASPYLKKMGKSWDDYKRDPAVQEAVVRAETANNERIMKGWGKEALTDLERWTAHNLGIGNMRKIHEGNVTDKSLLKAVRNQAGKPQDVAEYLSKYGAKFGSQKPVMDSTDGTGLVPKVPVQDSASVSELFKGLGQVQRPPVVRNEIGKLFETVQPTAVNGLGGFTGF